MGYSEIRVRKVDGDFRRSARVTEGGKLMDFAILFGIVNKF